MILGLAFVLMALSPGVPTGAAETGRYVALGDSYSAGAGIQPESSAMVPSGCEQSKLSYPYGVQTALGFASFNDVTCASAVIGSLTAPETVPGGTNPPQELALDGTEQLVTFSLGGNDIGFSEIVNNCFNNSDPNATPCQNHFSAPGVTPLRARADALAPKLATALMKTMQLAPDARVFVIGYPAMLASDGADCFSTMHTSTSDAIYYDQFEQYLNSTIKTTAEVRGATFIDTYASSLGHDACKPPGVRWLEPVSNPINADAVHPNAAGHAAETNEIVNEWIAQVGPSPSATSTSAITSLSVSPRTFRPTPRGGSTVRSRTALSKLDGGATASIKLSASAKLSIQLIRRRAGVVRNYRCVIAKHPDTASGKVCARLTTISHTLKISARSGTTRLYLTGRWGGRKLSPGLYYLSATELVNGKSSTRQRATFRIKH